MADEREETSRKRNMKADVFISYGNIRMANLVQIPETSKPGHKKRPGNPGPESIACAFTGAL